MSRADGMFKFTEATGLGVFWIDSALVCLIAPLKHRKVDSEFADMQECTEIFTSLKQPNGNPICWRAAEPVEELRERLRAARNKVEREDIEIEPFDAAQSHHHAN